MKMLITGPLGHIGSELLNNLNKFKKLKKVYLIDNARSNNLNVLFKLKYKNIKIKFIYGNLLNKKILSQINDNIDVVIHLASISNAEESFKIRKLIYYNNFEIFKNIVNFCIKKKAKLIHLSSTSVYGKQDSMVDENCKSLEPQSPYAHIKLLEEKYLKKNKNKLNFVSLRLGTIARVSKGMRFHTAVNKFCLNTILKVEIPIWNNAIDQYRPYLSLSDAVKVIHFIVKKNLFNKQTYNILTGNYTVRQILNIIKKNNFKIKIRKTKSPILNQNSYQVSRKKIEKFKIKFSNNLDKDIKNTLNLLKGIY